MTDTAKIILVIVTTLVVVYRPASAQFVGCYSQAECNGQVPATSADDCCINIDNGLYYDNGTGCMQCITFGWMQSTFEGQEQSSAFTVQGGYSKGDGAFATVDVFVDLVRDPEAIFHPRMADFGGNLLTSSTPISLRRPEFGNTNIQITLAVDNIGQEGIERGILRMRIDEDSAQPVGTFFRRDLRVTINDTSMVTIGFNLNEYANNEDVSMIRSVVRKSEINIAHPVTLRVEPLTIDEALSRGLEIPTVEGNLNITINNTEERMRIPIRAKAGDDFSTKFTDITFPVDEGSSLELNNFVNINITNDDIDEADREYFILYLSLQSDPLPGLVLGTTVSVGGIDDNDILQISFERSSYTYMEPPGPDPFLVEDIYMVKNIVTELTYRILFEIVTAEATRNQDYETTLATSLLDFPPNQQRFQLFNTGFPFAILPDITQEGEETVEISSEPVDNPPPAYTRPQTRAVTTLFILDDDNITAGWDQTSYTVSESVGTFQAYYSLLNPSVGQFLASPVFMRVATIVGTADENDYRRIRGSQQEEVFTNTMRRASADVTIRTDNVYEGVEVFSLDLFFASPQAGFFVIPNVTTVNIIDTTELTIGFIGAPYQAMENMGPMIFTVGVIGDTELTTDVVVSFSTVDGSTSGRTSAVDVFDYVGRSNVSLTFNAATKSINVSVDLINDRVYEGDEDFSGTLALVSDSPRVTIDPNNTEATILDDEEVTVGFIGAPYRARENMGPMIFTVGVIGDTVLNTDVEVSFSTEDGSTPGRTAAVEGSDYDGLFNVSLIFNAAMRIINVSVDLFDDNVHEGEEEFNGILTSDSPRVTVSPDNALAIIEDDEDLTIGFIGAPYRATENMGPMVFTVGVIGSTELARDVVVSFSTVDGSTSGRIAVAGSDYVGRSDVRLTFNAGTTSLNVSVDLRDDNLYEREEDFNGNLTFVSGERVTVSPDNALATILDDEVVCQALPPLVNGRITYLPDTTAPYDEGTNATHICNAGFALVGNIIRTCQNNGSFDGTTPTCQPIECLPLAAIVNGFITYATDNTPNYSLGTVATYGCNDGFILNLSVGSEMRTCIDDGDNDVEGVFNLMAPTCDPIECEPLPDIANGRITYSDDMTPNYDLGTMATYECNPGFYLMGDDERNCTAGNGTSAIGVFDKQEPACVPIECLPLPNIANGMITYSNDGTPNYALGTVATYICDTGFALNLTVGSEMRTCIDDNDDDAEGVFDMQEPACVPIECPPLSNIANGMITYSNAGTPNYPLTTVATYSCNAGFVLDLSVGSETRTCIDDGDNDAEGVFDMQEPACVPIVCPPLSSIMNGRITYSNPGTPNYPLGTTATYSCDAGYVLDLTGSGSETRTCIDNGDNDAEGVFSGQAPACIPIECPPLPSIANGMISYSNTGTPNYPLTTVATYSCNAGFVLDLSVGSETRTCIDDGDNDAEGVFDMQEPACVPIECEPLPSISNGMISYSTSGSPNYELGTVATYSCNPGYSLNLDNGGSETRTCVDDGDNDAEGMFNGQEPSCIFVNIIRVNDTVIGDPLMTVPLYVQNKSVIMPTLGENDVVHLCFEVHGRDDAYFNLISDDCVSVNAHYERIQPNEDINIIDNIAVRAVDSNGTCRNIEVSLDQCIARVDGVVVSSQGYSSAGVSVRTYPSRVRIAVPNCGPLTGLVMWVMCQSQTFWSTTETNPDGSEVTFQGDAIRFVVARGLNLRMTSHGILGQFWNIPIDVVPYNGPFVEAPEPGVATFSVNISYPEVTPRRFVAWLRFPSWELDRRMYCLYAGDGHAGSVYEVPAGPDNGPVIEGVYTDYIVGGQFETDFRYSHFESSRLDNRVNDTVTGDPLFTVPLNVPDKSNITEVGDNDPINLCFEIHGRADAHFNLVSDACVSVNARYSRVRADENINIIDRIYVRASDASGSCKNIKVSLNECSASVDGVSVESYMAEGISVRRYRNRVRIVVPNCQDIDLVMWVFCLNNTFWSRTSTNENEVTFEAEMIRFVIARGLDLAERSHGILGQFWNVPMQVEPYTGPVQPDSSSDGYYVITTNHPDEGMRQFVGWIWPLTWEHRSEYCLYAGQYQGGPLYEIVDDSVNNGVIFGTYDDYEVDSSYATDFAYSHFNESQCAVGSGDNIY